MDQRTLLLHSLLNSVVSVRAEDTERIPKSGPLLIVCNHSDLIDPLIQAMYSGRGLCYLAKAELFGDHPERRIRRFLERARRAGAPEILTDILEELTALLSQMFADARLLPVVRAYRGGDAAGSVRYYDEVVQKVTELLDRGEAVVIYPEGSRSQDGRLQRFRGLAARIALTARVPIVPTAISGAFGFSDLNRWISDRQRTSRSISYRVGEVIDPAEYLGPDAKVSKESIKDLTQRLRNDVAALLERRPRRPRAKRATKKEAPAQKKKASRKSKKAGKKSKGRKE